MELWKQEWLSLAKSAILEGLWQSTLGNYKPISKQLQMPWAAFVTLKKWSDKRGELRWCIWSLIPTRFLCQDIIQNAKNAAFRDPRFSPLSLSELSQPHFLEISVLSSPYEVKFENINQLLDSLRKQKPGVIIELWWKQATFLPSVWEELPDEEQFLIHLLLKAGINPQEFVRNFDIANIHFYDSEEFGESWDKILDINKFLKNVWR